MQTYIKYFVMLLLIMSTTVYYFYVQKNLDFMHKVSSSILKILDDKIKNEKENAFSFSYVLSKNEILIQSILDNNNSKAYEILKDYMKGLDVISRYNLNVQIITKDFKIFARSWDTENVGADIIKSRPDLKIMFKTHKPNVSYEAARRLVLISSIPIIKNKKIIAFVEVIGRFENLKNYFLDFGIDIIVLLNPDFNKQSVLLDHSDNISGYTIANKNINFAYKVYLNRVGVVDLLYDGIKKGPKEYYVSKMIFNSNHENIGNFILVIPTDKMKIFNSFEENLNIFLNYAKTNVFDGIKVENNINKYDDFTIPGLIRRNKSSYSNKTKKALKNKLENLSKSELINIIISKNNSTKIRGNIK